MATCIFTSRQDGMLGSLSCAPHAGHWLVYAHFQLMIRHSLLSIFRDRGGNLEPLGITAVPRFPRCYLAFFFWAFFWAFFCLRLPVVHSTSFSPRYKSAEATCPVPPESSLMGGWYEAHPLNGRSLGRWTVTHVRSSRCDISITRG